MRSIYRCLSIMAVLLLLCALGSPSLRAAAKSSGGRSIRSTRAALSTASAAGFELLGSLALGGPVSAVAIQGSYAYVGVGNRQLAELIENRLARATRFDVQALKEATGQILLAKPS